MLKQIAALKGPVERLVELERRAEDLAVLVELGDEAGDEATAAEALA